MTAPVATPDYVTIGGRWDLWKHRWQGSPIPPPHLIKLFWLDLFRRKYGITTLIETGTYFGFTLDALKTRFEVLFSIELDDSLYKAAVEKFKDFEQVHLLHGDSATLLDQVLRDRSERCLLWLDGHYSGPGTARGSEDSPIVMELDAIARHGRTDHVIVIDDARYFDGRNGYLSVEAVSARLRAINPHYQVTVVDDSIRALPPRWSVRRASSGR